GNDADFAFFLDVLVRHAVTPAVLDAHLQHERDVVREGGQDMFGVNDLYGFGGDDVGTLDNAAFVAVDADGLRLVGGVPYDQALDVQDDVRHIFHHAGDGADFVLDALDLDAGDGATFQAGQQDAPQAVAHGDAEAAFKRLGRELTVGVRQRRP